ncbi:MAG: urease accessory protein UreE [Phormidesmis sp. RL_2_1]|nr:urease accessory protein UreE [Phormidesmis sp. RL_2_1]
MTNSLPASWIEADAQQPTHPQQSTDPQQSIALADNIALADTYLGNVRDSAELALQVAQAQQNGECWEVLIDRGDRMKGRIFTQTATGQAIGIVKGRDWRLQNGDVLATAQGQFVKVTLQSQQVMALRFDQQISHHAIALVHLGHMMGNHHWPITVQGETLYVALVAEPAVMASTVREVAQTLGIEGLQITYEEKSVSASLDFSTAREKATHPHHHEHPHPHHE